VLAEPRTPSDKDKQTASDLVKRAIARSQVGDHGGAILIYNQANALVPNTALLSNIASEYQQSGKPKEALQYFCMYLEKDPEGTNAPFAISQAKILQAQLGNKDVDEDDVCAPPKPKRSPRDNPRPVKDPTEDTTEPTRPAGSGRGDPRPDTTLEREGTTSHSGGGSGLKYVALTAGLLGVAGLGIGAYEGVQAQNISDAISKHPKDQAWANDIRATEARGQHYENLQIAAMISGGVLLATGTILYLVDRSGSSENRNRTAVRVTPTTNGFAVFGRF